MTRDAAEAPVLPHSAGDDEVQPFLLESSGIRGRLLRLGPLANEILDRHPYPDPVKALLGELLALAGALSSLMKYEGVFTAQAKGDGPLHLLVADVTAEGDLRGYAGYDAARLELLLAEKDNPALTDLMGRGSFAYSVDLGDSGERYQGIVALKGATLADCLQHYFLQSDQVQSGLLLAAESRAGHWRAGALVLQRIPEEGGIERLSSIEDEDAWRRAMVLQVTCTTAELLDPALPAHDLLYRLFSQEGVRVFKPRPLAGNCRCSLERIASVLSAMPRAEVEALKVGDHVEAVCEFCSSRYRFDEADLERLFGRP